MGSKQIKNLPTPVTANWNNGQSDSWLRNVSKQLQMQTGDSWPTTDTLANNSWVVFYNTSANQVRLVVNRNGTIVKSAAYT